jgi:hypothetical protein
MISAIEGFIPSATKNDRRFPSATQPVATPRNAQINDSGWRPRDQPAAAEQPADPPASASTEPLVSRVPQTPLAHDAGQLNPFRVPAPTTSFFNVALDAINSVKLPYSAKLSEFAHSR